MFYAPLHNFKNGFWAGTFTEDFINPSSNIKATKS